MKAMRIHEHGAVDVFCYEDVLLPKVDNDQVLIKVRATSVNPLDWKLRSGIYPIESTDFPFTLGFDASGDIVEVGSSVTQFSLGEAVYGFIGGGGYAEYAVVSASDIAHKPTSLDYIQAAAIPAGAITAWQALIDSIQLVSGQTILIHGAAGGVGTMAVQLAKWRGAKVIGTASARNHTFLRELGADEVIDYNTTPFEDVVHDVDVVFDTVGGETLWRSWKVLKTGGKLRTICDDSAPELATKYGIDASLFSIERPFAPPLLEISRLVERGHLKPIVSTVLPLQEVAQAHRLSEGRHMRGKIVLQIGEST